MTWSTSTQRNSADFGFRAKSPAITLAVWMLVALTVTVTTANAAPGKVTKKSLIAALKQTPRNVRSQSSEPLSAQWGAALVVLDPTLAPVIAEVGAKERAIASTVAVPRLAAFRSQITAQSDGGFAGVAILVAATSFGQSDAPTQAGSDDHPFDGGSLTTSADGKGSLSQGVSIGASVPGEAGPTTFSQGLKISGSACPGKNGVLEFTIDLKNSVTGTTKGGNFADERQDTGRVTVQVGEGSTIATVKTNLRVQTHQGINGDTPYVDANVSATLSHRAGELGARPPGIDEQSGSWTTTASSGSVTRSSSTANVETASASIAQAAGFAANAIATYLTQVEFGLRTQRCTKEPVAATPVESTAPKSPPKTSPTKNVDIPSGLLFIRIGLAFTQYDIDYTLDKTQFSFRLQSPAGVQPLVGFVTPPLPGAPATFALDGAVDRAFTAPATRTITDSSGTKTADVIEGFTMSIDAKGLPAGKAITGATVLTLRFRPSTCCFDELETQFKASDLLNGKLLSFPFQGPDTYRNAVGSYRVEFTLRLQCLSPDGPSAACALELPAPK